MWHRIRQALNAHTAAPAGARSLTPGQVPLAPSRPHPVAAPAAQAAPRGVTRYTFCHHPSCRRGAGGLATALRREAVRLGLNLEMAKTLTVCPGECRSGPLVGLPELGLFYAGLAASEVHRMLLETSLAGRLLHPRLHLDPTVVTDSRVVFVRHENVLVAMEADYCLVGLVTYLFEFNAAESCGKCFPCRLGVHRVDRLLRTLLAGGAQEEDLAALEEATWTMARAGYCQFAQRITEPLRLTLDLARPEFARHLGATGCGAHERFIWQTLPGAAGRTGGEA